MWNELIKYEKLCQEYELYFHTKVWKRTKIGESLFCLLCRLSVTNWHRNFYGSTEEQEQENDRISKSVGFVLGLVMGFSRSLLLEIPNFEICVNCFPNWLGHQRKGENPFFFQKISAYDAFNKNNTISMYFLKCKGISVIYNAVELCSSKIFNNVIPISLKYLNVFFFSGLLCNMVIEFNNRMTFNFLFFEDFQFRYPKDQDRIQRLKCFPLFSWQFLLIFFFFSCREAGR